MSDHKEPCPVLCGSLDGGGDWAEWTRVYVWATSLCSLPETITTLLTGHAWICAQLLTRVWLSLRPHVTCQAPLSKGSSRQEYWSGLPFPPPGVFQTQGLNPCLLGLMHWQTGYYLSHQGSAKICHCFYFFPFYLPWSDGTRCHDLKFFESWLLSWLFHAPLSPSSGGSSVPFHSLWLESYHPHILRLLIFLPVILIPACESSSLAFHMMYSAYKLNKQGDSVQSCTPFPILNQIIVWF